MSAPRLWRFSKGTRSLFVAKCMTVIAVVAHPTSVACAKVQVLKCSMAATMLTDAKSKLHSNRLAIQGKVQVGHSFEAYHLAKRLVEQHNGRQFIR